MLSLAPRFSRINHTLFVIGIASLAATIAGVIFVAARSEDGETPPTHVAVSTPETKARIAERFGQLPLSFESNQGQTDTAVKFLAHGPGYDLFLTANEAVLSLQKPRTQAIGKFQRPGSSETSEKENALREGSVLRLKMIGANADPRAEGHDELPGKVNYFIGNDPEKWRRNVPTYRKVYYTNVYPGIDIVYYGNQRELEYDFIVAAGADPNLIKFNVEGAERIRLDQQGNLVLALRHGEVQLKKPFIYQLTDEGSRTEVKGSYVINRNEISFKVRGADSGKPLVIDPVLSYSTYLGGNGNDQALGIAVDAQGSAYITGTTDSLAFPTTAGAFKTGDLIGAFVTKLDPTGSTLIYSTFLSGRDPGIIIPSGPFTGTTAIAVDASGNAYVTGITTDPDFPVVNPLKTSGTFFKTTNAGSSWNNTSTGLTEDVNALAVAPANSNIVYAGSFSGVYRSADAGASWTKSATGASLVSAIAVDPTNPSVVYAGSIGLFKTTDGGNTWTTLSLPQSGAHVRSLVFAPSTPSTIYVGSSAGLFRSTDGGSTWTTLNNFGFPSGPDILSIAIDPAAPATIYAGTSGVGIFKTTNGGSTWTAINNGIISGFGGNSSVVDEVTIDPFNSSTLYINVVGKIHKSTNGGDSWSLVNNSAVVGGINAMVADRTNPSTLYVGTVGGGVIKTTNGGTSWTSVNTGLWSGIIRVLVVDPSNSAVLYAGGSSNNILMRDAFATKLNSTGSDLLFSTYLGGSGDEIGNGIAIDSSGNIYVAGNTLSSNFPTQNAFQPAQPSSTTFSWNAFVTRINPAGPSYVYSTYLGGDGQDQAHAIAVDPAGNAYVTGNTISTNFPIANAFQPNLGDTFAGDAFVTKFSSNGSLSYSTFLGGNNPDTGFGIAVDASGNAYVTGVTLSTNFPVANPIQTANDLSTGASDAFVTKLNSQGSALVYSTFLGGANHDVARGIAVDASGKAYVTGFTGSLDFPLVAGALRTRSSVSKSVNAAVNWSNDNYGLKAPVTHLVVHPTQPSTVYAGTGNGVFRSTDGGKTWSPINNGLDARFVTGLVIDPLTPTTLYVAGIGNNSGVYKSIDGGNSWTMRSNGMTNNNMRGLAIDPVTPTTLYAGTLSFIFKTTDGAGNWAPTGDPPPIVALSLAVDPHFPTNVFAAGSFNTGGVFRSLDSGATWQSVLSQSGDDGRWVGVSPLTPGLVYASLNLAGFFKSVDGGDNWTFVRSGRGKVVFDPVSASTLYLLSNTEGVLKSTDNGQTWIPRNSGLPVKNAVELAVNPLRTSTLYMATASTHDEDAFVTKINSAGSALIYSTLVGGNQAPEDSLNMNDEAFAIAVDQSGNAYITGFARSPDFPTTANGFQSVNLGGFSDTFISKLTMSHIISGRVLDAGGAPVNGAEVVLADGVSVSSIVTEADGAYEFSHLREGGSFTVSAAKPHFTMAPPSQSFSNLTSNQVLNFTATATNASFFTISGQVSELSAGMAGATVTLGGAQSGVRITDNNGNYSFEVAGGANYTVTPSATGFTVNPPSQTFNNLSAAQTANFAAIRESIVVTNVNNHGTGSLREAIINANSRPGPDTIVFKIPGPGVKVINVLTPLPEITEAVEIDASTQPGYAGSPLIELNGENVPFESGLVIRAGHTVVRGFAIGRFGGSGIELRKCDGVLIQGNYIGVDATGSVARTNGTGILLTESSSNSIGGTTAAARNVISGNDSAGIEIVVGSGNIVQGNFIGTNASGTAAIANRDIGVALIGSGFNVIGGTLAGAGNVISGNSSGISAGGPGNIIQGNLIGTNATGTGKIPNTRGIQAIAPNILIGGLTPSARNVISGNGTGVVIGGEGSKVQGNFIGTDITGTLALGNSFDGVIAGEGALIGGTVAGARNVISGNEQSNLSLVSFGSGPGVTVQGNYIGTDVTGNRAVLAFTNISRGINVISSDNLIGGLDPAAQNVISGNAVGIRFSTSNVGVPERNSVVRNVIGLNAAGTAPVPNSQGGVEFFQGRNNVLGGGLSGSGNTIAFNGKFGVMVSDNSSGNTIRGNGIFSNDGLGIDLGPAGVTANDANDADTGGNNLQNFPVITSVSSSGTSSRIQGSFRSLPNLPYHIDFYLSSALDPSGNGEGAVYFATINITASPGGEVVIDVIGPPIPPGRVLTATATDSDGNTSEFSPGDITTATGNLQFSVDSIRLIEDLGILNVTVLRKGGSNGNVSVDFATVDVTAIAGQDYTATSGRLNFSNGETSKTIQIPIINNEPTEPNETFMVVLRDPSNVEALGLPNTLTVTVQDRTTVPSIFLDNQSVTEGDTGSTTEALFPVSLSALTGRTITAHFATSNIIATGGASCNNQGTDYETRSGTLTFQPGNAALTIPIRICGDTSAEANETFRITLSNTANAVLDEGIGTIVDDDELELLLEESGPVVNQAAALDAVLFLRDPFPVVGLPEMFANGPDRNTRVMFFVRNLQLNPGEGPSAVVVRLTNNVQLTEVFAQDVRPAPNVDFTQVIIRLPSNLLPGTYTVTIRAHTRFSNTGTIRIAP